MNLVIPPLIIYTVGTMLIIGGTLRALLLGRRRPDREIADDDPARAQYHSRHMRWGIIWVLMGVGLIASTAGVLRSKAPGPVRIGGPATTGAPPAER